MNEFQQQILEKIEQIALKLQNYKHQNSELTKRVEELMSKLEYVEKKEEVLNSQLKTQQIELDDKSQLINKATNKIEELLGSIDTDG